MQTKNVFYSKQPDRVMVYTHTDAAVVDFPVNIVEVETEDGTQWKAGCVYTLRTRNTPNLKDRIENNYEAWLEKAMIAEPQTVSLDDVVEAINVLTDLMLGGE